MPYPPPPGPPTVGFFQGIGRLIAPTLPDVTGHATEFLETDGVIPQWEPVTGALPDPTGHAGEFLTTPDGVTVSWVAVSFGGITTIGAVTTGQANAAVISGGGTTLQLSAASLADPGIWTTGAQVFAGAKRLQDGGTTLVYDLTQWGAVPNDPTNNFGQAFYNAMVAAKNQFSTPAFLSFLLRRPVSVKLYLPAGVYYSEWPICIPNACEFYGDGPEFTLIAPGRSSPGGANPSFSGPVIITQPCYLAADLPGDMGTYDAPAVGAVGQSIVLDNSNNYYLDDAWAWSHWSGALYTTTALDIRLWFKPTDAASPGFLHNIVSSLGPINLWGLRTGDRDFAATDCAYGIFLKSDGVNVTFKSVLTANPNFDSTTHMQPTGQQVVIESSAVTLNAWHYLELAYNGSHVDFYVDGVNQGHVVCTGAVVRTPWEGVNFGAGGPHGMLLPLPMLAAAGSLFSLQLSDVARHTGVGGYSLPSSAHAWDANTVALYNFDQGFQTVQPKNQDGSNNGPVLTLPFIVGQVRAPTGPAGAGLDGPYLHYIRRQGPFNSVGVGGQTWNTHLHHLSVNGYVGCSGVCAWISPMPYIHHVWAADTTQVGLSIETTSSFYGEMEHVRCFSSTGTGIFVLGNCKDAYVGDCGIGYWLNTGGQLETFHNQPSYRSYAHLYINDGSAVGSVSVKWGDYDTEVFTFSRQVSCLLVNSDAGSMVFEGNEWNSTLSSTAPAIYFKLPLFGSVVHIGDVFSPDAGNVSPSPPCSGPLWYLGDQPPGKIEWLRTKTYDLNEPLLPTSNVEGWIAEIDGGALTNLSGLSVSDIEAENLTGEFTVAAGTTSGGPLFFTPEVDLDYIVTGIVVNGYVGSAPASGSTRINNVVKRLDGFTAFLEADPGGTCEITFGFSVLRKEPSALLTVRSPSISGSVANPFSGEAGLPFAAGVTVIPVTGNCFQESTGGASPEESVFNCGPTPLGADWWELSFPAALSKTQYFMNSTGFLIDSYVAEGKLCNLFNPGAHNLVLYYGGIANGYTELWVDGHKIRTYSPLSDPGTQSSTVNFGARPGGTPETLTIATLSSFKMDRLAHRCVTFDSRIGPAGMAQAAFLGDDWVMGYAASIGTGFAQQKANATYGTTYYWMAVVSLGKVMNNLQTNFVRGLVTDIWAPWAGVASGPPLSALCIIAGWTDMWLGSGELATDVWARLQKVIEGNAAEAVWTPPVSNTNQYAICIFGVPTAGSCVLNVNGTNYTIPFITSIANTTDQAIIQLNGTAPFNTAFTASLNSSDSRHQTLIITSQTPGTFGNSYTATVDGANNSLLYGSVGGIPESALAVNLFGGVDNLLRVAGVDFVCNFDTNADTTVNDVKALINAHPTVGALVTASLDAVAHKMVVVANTAGASGNAIGIFPSVQRNYGPGVVPVATSTGLPTKTLAGGFNGTDQLGVASVILCTVPPMKGVGAPYTAGKEAQRVALNISINAYVHAGVSVYDLDALVRDPGDNTQLLPAYAGASGYLNDAGHNAVYAAIGPLLP